MRRFLILLAALMLLPVLSAQAATFCTAAVGSTPQCIYEDVESCTKAAVSSFSSCIVNPDAPLNYWGGQRYCTIDSGRAVECIFNDRNQCNAAASQRHGICIDNAIKPDDIDPYLYDNRVQR